MSSSWPLNGSVDLKAAVLVEVAVSNLREDEMLAFSVPGTVGLSAMVVVAGVARDLRVDLASRRH